MATVFKNLTNNDVAQTKTLLNEAIPLTGTIVSGTYSDENIKNYTHGMFQSVYDYPVLSASSNHIFDITYGYASNISDPTNIQNQKKLNIYNQMAQVLAGYDVTSSIRKFDLDGNYATTGDTMDECVFLNYSRLLTKDEIKKGSYTLELNLAGSPRTLYDADAQNSYKINSPAGEYGLLYTSSVADSGNPTAPYGVAQGHIYYQAGIAVITASAGNFGAAAAQLRRRHRWSRPINQR